LKLCFLFSVLSDSLILLEYNQLPLFLFIGMIKDEKRNGGRMIAASVLLQILGGYAFHPKPLAPGFNFFFLLLRQIIPLIPQKFRFQITGMNTQ
jgi:hypothetical protein